MRECVICGSTMNVGEVITRSPYGTRTNRYYVCMRHIKKIEDYLEGKAKITPRRNPTIVKPNSETSTLADFLETSTR